MIDSRAVIDPAAELDEGVSVAPFAVIGAQVRIGAGTRVGPHAVIRGPTVIGRDNRIFQFTSIGEDPQDLKYGGEDTDLVIGDRNRIREFCTIHRGTAQDAVTTRVGSDNLLMAYTHVAHDCQIGDHVIMANAASLGGHVKLQDWVILGGFTVVHQFCEVGAHAFSAMGTTIAKDVPPFVIVGGHPARPRGINLVGLRRRSFSEASITALRRAYRKLYMSGARLEEAITMLEALSHDQPEVQQLVAFIRQSDRSIVR